jgi:hypothetical protein
MAKDISFSRSGAIACPIVLTCTSPWKISHASSLELGSRRRVRDGVGAMICPNVSPRRRQAPREEGSPEYTMIVSGTPDRVAAAATVRLTIGFDCR